jgi:hypothetical protein
MVREFANWTNDMMLWKLDYMEKVVADVGIWLGLCYWGN